MSETWKRWEGQVVDHKYQLQQYLGSTDHSVVFLAEFHDPEPRRIAIKFVSAEVAGREQQLADWNSATQLNHPNLLKIYGAGQCSLQETDLLYVAMEYAEENLSQVLPHRALVADEAREMLNAVSDVLVYLHDNKLVHGHIKPSNILASGELLKLSSDTICPAGEAREMRREQGAYDAPELPGSPYATAADVWSLGVTLVEALTQQPAFLPFNEQADPIVPSGIREPFQEIARQALRRDPRLRWTAAKIAEKLNPTTALAKSVAAGAGTTTRAVASSASPVAVTTEPPPPMPPTVSPLNVPLSKERAVPLAKQPPLTRSASRPRATGEVLPSRETVLLPSYVLPLFAALLVVLALIVLPFALRHRTAPQASSFSLSSSASSPKVVVPPTTSAGATSQPTPQAPPSNAIVPPAKSVSAPTTPSPAQSQPAAPTSAGVATSNPRDSGSTASETPNFSGAKGEALDQVRPATPARALATIHGTVRVRVKVHVDPAGSVSAAELDNAGPSRYFADLSLKAAQQWVFTPPELDGHSVASDWLIEFAFTHAGVETSYQPSSVR